MSNPKPEVVERGQIWIAPHGGEVIVMGVIEKHAMYRRKGCMASCELISYMKRSKQWAYIGDGKKVATTKEQGRHG